jgi:hypothetical protein
MDITLHGGGAPCSSPPCMAAGLLGVDKCEGGAPCSSPLFLVVRPRDEPVHFAEGEHFPTFLIVVLNNGWNPSLKNIKLPPNGVHVSSSIPR